MERTQLVRKLAAPLLTLSVAGIAAIGTFEGNRAKVYLDPPGIPTVCMGTTKGLTRADVGRLFTPEQCSARNREALSVAEGAVRECVRVPISQGQFDAMVSFTYNVGNGAFCKSTLVRKLNAGNCAGAAAEFPKWIKAQGAILPGLVKRRAAERVTFEADCG